MPRDQRSESRRPRTAGLFALWTRMTSRAPAWFTTVLVIVALLGVSVLVVPGMRATGGVAEREVFSLNRGDRPADAEVMGAVDRGVDGYVVRPRADGSVTIPIDFSAAADRNLIRVWAFGREGLTTRVSVVAADGTRQFLGSASEWQGRTFDITRLAGNGRLRLEASASNTTTQPALFLDQVGTAVASSTAKPDARAWQVAIWVGLLMAALLHARRKLGRHWVLPIGSAALAWLLWDGVLDAAYVPLEPNAASLWSAANAAEPFSLATGFLSGSFGEVSALAVQLDHALTAIVGTGTAAARSATVLTAVAALALVYAFANRVAGPLAATVALVIAVLADPFRDAAITGTSTMALIAAAALFLLVVHACLAETNKYAAGLLGAAGGVAFLADPTWFPGILFAIIVLGALYGPRGQKLKVVGVGALVLMIVILPNRISTADQSGGDLLADVSRRSTFVRNVEFAGAGRGAPQREDLVQNPFGGEPVGLTEYLFEEHTLSVVVGGTLSGATDAMSRAADRDESGLVGLAGWILTLLGTAYLLIVPRLRLLVLLPLALAAPTLFFVSREAADPFTAAAPVWPALVTGAGVLVFVGRRLWHDRRSVVAEGRAHEPGGSSTTLDDGPLEVVEPRTDRISLADKA